MRNVRTAAGLGCWVIYDFQMDRNVDPWLVHCNDTWWSKLFGPDMFGTIELICMSAAFSAEHTPVSADVAFFATSFPKLRGLLLEGSGFGDDACAEIRRMACLEKLWLVETKVSDRGARELMLLGGLRQLEVANSQLSEECVRELRTALSHCVIDVSWPERKSVTSRKQTPEVKGPTESE